MTIAAERPTDLDSLDGNDRFSSVDDNDFEWPDDTIEVSDADLDRGLHTILLVLSGRLPDYVTADARSGLADGHRADVTAVLAQWALGGLIPVTGEEVEAIASIAELLKVPIDGLDAAAVVPAIGRPPYLFSAGPDRPAAAAELEPAAVLTEVAPADDTELALIDELSNYDGVQAVWRCWRHGVVANPYRPLRVFVIEADPTADLPAIAGAGQSALRAMPGAPGPSGVEVYATGEPLPPYLGLARTAGHLIAADEADELIVVPIFDGIDESGGWFRADHPILDPETSELVESYLSGGTVIMDFDDDGVDVVRPDRGAVVPLQFVTDGRWIWSAATSFYLREYGLSPDRRLVDMITAVDGAARPADAVNDVTALRAAAALSEVDATQVLDWS